MSDKNLPIKVIMQKPSDSKRKPGGGSTKFFEEITPELHTKIADKFKQVLQFYDNLFQENQNIPAVGRILVKPEAIAKSHKPNDLCKFCQIIGTGELDEIFIKVTKDSLLQTIHLVNTSVTKKVQANLTTIADIQPVTFSEKISDTLTTVNQQGDFDLVKDKIKIKFFDFNNVIDNSQIIDYVKKEIFKLGITQLDDLITYGEKIKYLKIQVNTYDEIVKIAKINGIKTIDYFRKYSLPSTSCAQENFDSLLEIQPANSEVNIGIIDGGISDSNAFLKPYISAREEYVPEEYRNPLHATFIASTILYGNVLNKIMPTNSKRFNFVDIVAIPNGDPEYGPIDFCCEEDLMEIIEKSMEKYAANTKIWNLSIGLPNLICNDLISDLGAFIDYIQDKYQVQFFVSSGNLCQLPLREWPDISGMGERDRIISPADSVRAITVGSIALHESNDSYVKMNEPSPFSRRGPGANFIVKPDVVDYGGNLSRQLEITNLGMKGLDISGKIVEGNGTSFATPRIVEKFASIYDELIDKDLLLTKAMIVHSARMNTRELLQNKNYINYYGFGTPATASQEILQCGKNEITLVFKQKVHDGNYLEMLDFPYPVSLIRDGKCFGEIGMTLAYNPILDENFGQEYCRANIDVSFGIYNFDQSSGKVIFNGQIPLESAWEEKYEKAQVENGFKWSPMKSYYRKISSKGIKAGLGWKIRVDLNLRNEQSQSEQEFILLLTIKAPKEFGEPDIYSEVVKGLNERGYYMSNLEVRGQVRQRP